MHRCMAQVGELDISDALQNILEYLRQGDMLNYEQKMIQSKLSEQNIFMDYNSNIFMY